MAQDAPVGRGDCCWRCTRRHGRRLHTQRLDQRLGHQPHVFDQRKPIDRHTLKRAHPRPPLSLLDRAARERRGRDRRRRGRCSGRRAGSDGGGGAGDAGGQGRAPKTGYSREQFGDGWVDTDRNGCDTRDDVLARDLTAETFKPGTRDCVVASGTLADPYSGKIIAFTRGQDTSTAVQIDHVVALSDAWQKGAQQWDDAKRVAFANDPLELLAVDGPLNGQKSDGDAATWLPLNRAYRCAYVARQVGLKATWRLWVTPPSATPSPGCWRRARASSCPPGQPRAPAAAVMLVRGPPVVGR
ncbi:HNH endonuclease family protein [Kineococcus aurantiacus]|uniref:HNH endonuclease family protein n=1 Tax=Kineococcus aurantiacus TaxID=37633 RepID=UPI003387E040